jgi:hypothetical protein
MIRVRHKMVILIGVLLFSTLLVSVYESAGYQALGFTVDPSGSWNPNVTCSSVPIVSIADITGSSTGITSFDNSPFSPGIAAPPNYSNALQIDGSASNSTTSSTSISVTLSTNSMNDVIYLAIGSSNVQSSYNVSDKAQLAWTKRASVTGTPVLATYAAISSSSLSSDVVTVKASASASLNVFVFGISGADTQSFVDAFDGAAGVPSFNSGTGSTLSTTISTTANNDMLIGVGFQLNGPTLTAVSPFSMVSGNSKSLSVESQTISTWQSSVPVKFTSSGSGSWVIIGDAISRDGGPHGGGVKRWLTNALGNAPTGWVQNGPECTITNLKGSSGQASFVEIDGVKVSALKESGDCSANFDLINGGGPMGGTYCDYTFNAYDPSVNPSNCTSPLSSACYEIIHVEVDQDWQGAGFCATQCNPSSLVSLISSNPNAVIDIQGFVYWDPEEVTIQAHSFSGWEIHPLTAWRIDQSTSSSTTTTDTSSSSSSTTSTYSFSVSTSSSSHTASTRISSSPSSTSSTMTITSTTILTHGIPQYSTTTTSSQGGHSGGSFSTVLIISAVVVAVVIVGASLFVRRRS